MAVINVRGGRCPPHVAIAAIVLLIANVAYGQWRLHQTSTLAPGPRVLAIQTNLPQDNKIGWSKDQWALDVPSFIDLTRRALEAAGGPANVDLIVWPETMVPSLGFELQTHAVIDEFNALVGGGEEHRTVWAKRIVTLQRELGVPMLVGSEAWLGARIARQSDGYIRVDRDKVYNSAYLVQGEPPYQRYDKNVLTPFGETMPYISNWKWLEKQFLALGARGMAFDLDSNPDVAALELRAPAQASSLKSQAYRLGTPICFEDCVAWLCRRMAYDASGKRADLLINISNDGWFGSSGADRRLHAEIARFRCIENRLPMVRCVNTGVSVHIDSSGRLVAAAGDGPYGSWGNPGWLLAHVQIDSRRTLFGSIGNSFAGFCGLLALGLILWTFGRRRRPPLASVVLQVKDSP